MHGRPVRAGSRSPWSSLLDCPGVRCGQRTGSRATRTEPDPVGAEKASNKDGTIPEWTAGSPRPPPAGRRARNASTVRQRQAAVRDRRIQRRPVQGQAFGRPGRAGEAAQGLPMDVYPTRRSCGFPDFVYERTKINAREAKLAANGWGSKGRRRRRHVPDPEDRRRACGTTRSATWARAGSSTTRRSSRTRVATSRRWCRTSGPGCPSTRRRTRASKRSPASR